MMGIPNSSFVGFNSPEKYNNFCLAPIHHEFTKLALIAFCGHKILEEHRACVHLTNFSLN